MLRNTTFNLPDDLLVRARTYAAAHGTTLTAIIRDHLEAVTASEGENARDDPLSAFSRGLTTKEAATKALGLRDYSELLIALGDADLPLPRLPSHEVENQAATFARLWNRT